MKNYVIATLIVIIIAMGSFVYKNEKSQLPRYKFPVSSEETKRTTADVPLFLYVFFSRNNCHDCLQIIEALNSLPPQYVVTGIVTEKELTNEMELRNATGALFPLVSVSKYKKYTPWYWPTVIGVSPGGDILFELPGVPGSKAYVINFIESIYSKMYPKFYEKKIKETSKRGYQK